MATKLLVDRGDDEIIHMAITKDNVAVNLENCKLWWYIGTSSVPAVVPNAIVTKDTDGADMVVIDEPGGLIDITLHPEDTNDIAVGFLNKDLPWEVQILDAGGKIQTIARGTIKIQADIIRAEA
ncbi:MAG TPA: hypothetical protein VFX15_02830 [Actinomycetes bacterium]|nr:hypothetical protein [Actinomycetes bacterium]